MAEKIKRQRKRERQLHGLNVLQHVLGLLTNVQQHRGISAALLNGDKSFAARLATKRNEIQGIFKNLGPLLSETPELRSDADSLLAVEREWEMMSSAIAHINSEQSFHKHTVLIRKIIHLLGDMGEHIGLLDGEGSPLALLSNTLLLKLPLLMESIGQARALGSGYAAKGQCGAVGRIRMNFLEQHIRECQQDISTSTENTNATQRVNALLNVLNERFIAVEEVNITPDAFFRTATDAIEACLNLWKDLAQITGEIVETRT
ncbi:MAG TPA: nitrate- and nitrite sensing domain-containing protein [Gallionellaceae bacterium]|nr:nitrate- and nitrite sensing domain-containing protein [Gallionellaceae bacterium]